MQGRYLVLFYLITYPTISHSMFDNSNKLSIASGTRTRQLEIELYAQRPSPIKVKIDPSIIWRLAGCTHQGLDKSNCSVCAPINQAVEDCIRIARAAADTQ